MKNFSDLLAIDSWLDIEIVHDHGRVFLRWPLMVNLDIACHAPSSVRIDGMEVLDFGYEHESMWRMTLHEPFYRWRHRVTGQGWLLEPAKILVYESNGNV